MRRPCRRSPPDPATRKRPGCGHMLGTTGLLAATIRRWWLIALRTAAAANASSVMSRALPAFCRLTAMPPIIGLTYVKLTPAGAELFA